MTTEQLQTTQDGLTAIDGQLAALPADGRVAHEIKALRDVLADVTKLVAATLRGQ